MLAGKRISTRNTFFRKRVLPVLLLGVLAAAVLAPLMLTRGSPNAPPWPVFVMPLALGVVFYVVLRRLVFDLADEVVDEGRPHRAGGCGAPPLKTSAPNACAPARPA